MFEFIRWYYICSRLFIYVYLCVFIFNVIIGNIYKILLLGEDYLSYLEFVFNLFDLINKICLIYMIWWFFFLLVDSFNLLIRFVIEIDNIK